MCGQVRFSFYVCGVCLYTQRSMRRVVTTGGFEGGGKIERNTETPFCRHSLTIFLDKDGECEEPKHHPPMVFKLNASQSAASTNASMMRRSWNGELCNPALRNALFKQLAFFLLREGIDA